MLLKNVTRITIGIVFVLLMVAVFQLQIQSAVAAAPQLPNNSCADCHRKLIFTSEKQREFVDIRIKHLESGISCSIVCHEDKLNKSIASTYAMWSVSTHALFNVTCEKCHGAGRFAWQALPARLTPRRRPPRAHVAHWRRRTEHPRPQRAGCRPPTRRMNL